MQRRKSYNPKRAFRPPPTSPAERVALTELAKRVTYGGNPEHKRNPGDFGLTPPSQPRKAKSLCDDAQVLRRADALNLLQQGLSSGLVSDRDVGGWPKNVWAVTVGGVPVEAQREGDGIYHGYPMPEGDPFRDEVLSRWRAR